MNEIKVSGNDGNRQGNRNNSSNTHSSRFNREDISLGGLGASQLLKMGKHWKWKQHRSIFFNKNWKMFITWTTYFITESIILAIVRVGKKRREL